MRAILTIVAAISALALAGCDPQDLPPQSKGAICLALQGPIYYNSYNPKSPRHAGPRLAIDLHTRNIIWRSLGCRWSQGVSYGFRSFEGPGKESWPPR